MKSKIPRILSDKQKEWALSDYCRENQATQLSALLQKYEDLDLTIDEGGCFWFALHYKNLEMLNLLMEYYKKHQLSGDRDSMSYKNANHALREILKVAAGITGGWDTPRPDIPVEIMEIIKPYIEDASDSDIDEDLDQYPDTYDADRDPPLNLALKQYGTHINSETGDCEEGSSDSGGSSEMDALGAGSYRALLGGGGGFSTSSDEGV